MTVVLIHGAPETPAIWAGLIAQLDRPTVTLQLPGFGRGSGPGLDDKDAYADWLAHALQDIDGPLDLLGHDWGGALATRVVATRQVAARSWASDVMGTWHPGNDWHPIARLWQSAAGRPRCVPSATTTRRRPSATTGSPRAGSPTCSSCRACLGNWPKSSKASTTRG
ncbi:pimeloyl-ACP methyl ester carboxylesterase [Amycolatopsis jiangsuensis]|uniref:Pimeloyl-ACP methyl ester carboxylesterase n=1 Tax=Amycolatopsis jiangsuensis TaxID=1181879 RepID=A0A840J4F2_9PSEU|nr:pimeloyl-ACP methyl ester carboxylesterase [Amycolatopsis jiangsuensis]